jgi:hypothetical protein
LEERAPPQVHDGAHLVLLGEEPHLGIAQPARPQDPEGILRFHLLEHGGLQNGHRRLGHVAPDIVAEKKETVPVNAGLGDVEVAANQGYHERIKQIVQKLVENLGPLPRIGLRALLVAQPGRREPLYVVNLPVCQYLGADEPQVAYLHPLHYFV